MRLALLGVRGSTPAPGESFVRYGGHTSCVAVLGDSPDAGPELVLDAGTGIRDLPKLLGGQPFRGAVVLSHLHWDHMYGLPFCPALDHPDSEVELWVPGSAGTSEQLLSQVMAPPFFPIDPSGLLGRWSFRAAQPGELALGSPPARAGSPRVRLAPLRHKGGLTFAIRVDLDDVSLAYMPDHALTGPDGSGDHADALELARGVDVLIHDGQYAGRSEAELAASYGHSTIEDALIWADLCDVGALILTHHAPSRSDDALDALAKGFTRTPEGRAVSFARQGDVVAVEPVTRSADAAHS